MTFKDAQKYINEIPKFTQKHSLEHTKRFLEELGDPERDLKIIHVAGTNGKGSACAMIAGVLKQCGKKTGLFTSPHLVCITERINIDGEKVSEDEFLKSFIKIKSVADEMEKQGYTHPSYFEFLFLMAMDIFRNHGVEYVVLETGLGGRLDATNVVRKPIVSVITSIGYDHMDILGDTIEKIAAEKAGIIKKNVPVVYLANREEVSNIIEETAKKCGTDAIGCRISDYKIIKKYNNHIDFCLQYGYYLSCVYSVPFIAEYQVQNAMLALRAIEQLPDIRDQYDNIKKGISEVKWEGRMEQIMDGVFIDGAHNGPGIDAFTKTVLENKGSGRLNVLFSVVKDKDYSYMAAQICDNIRPDKVYIAPLESDRGLDAEEIAERFKGVETSVSDSVEDAFTKALSEKQSGDMIFCVGSLYLVGEIKKIMSRRTMNYDKTERIW